MIGEQISRNTWTDMPHRRCVRRSKNICAAATAARVYDSTRKMLVITGDERVFEVPTGFSERLHGFLEKVITNPEAH
jgi:hypothetical protein